MKKILHYFSPEQEQSLFEKQKTYAFIIIAFILFFIAFLMMLNRLFSDMQAQLHIIMTSLLFIIIVINLFTLKKAGIKIAGNIFSIGIIILVIIPMNILNKDISILHIYIEGFYLILAGYSIGVLFASRKVLIINGLIILIATTRIFLYALEYNMWQIEELKSGYINHTITVIIISFVYYYINKFAENAINEAQKDAKIIKKQNIELKKHQEDLEILIAERTNELETTNEELKASNEELYNKTEIIEDQNSELNATLHNLKETQSNLLQAEKMASLGILTAGVAHEINNPLNYIMGSYLGLEKYFQKNKNNDQNIPILLNSLKVGVNRAADIVKGLNQFSRSNDNFTEDCDIHYIINNCLLMLNNQLKRRIEINKNFNDETILIPGNMGKLHQVFINILTNSIQSIENKGTISIISTKKEKNIAIGISDTGNGINKDNLSKITDPFFTTKDPGKGTGLGLSITYSIIKEHKGNINFKSEKNKGTTVKITLPLKKLKV